MIATGGWCPAIQSECRNWNKHQNHCSLPRNENRNGKVIYCRSAGAESSTVKDVDAFYRVTAG